MGGYIMSSTINADTTNGVVITSDISGEIELQSNGVTKAKITSNGLQNASGGAIISQAGKNLIINGDMKIAQRGTSVAGLTSGGYLTIDRFTTTINSAGTWTQTQDTDVPTGQGFANSLKMQCTTADTSLTSSDQLGIDTRLEGQNLQHLKFGTASAEDLTLSFWVKSNKTGTYTLEYQSHGATTRSISKSYTIDSANTWEKKIITIEGDTSGAFFNTNGLSLICKWWLAAASYWTSGTFNTSWSARINDNVVSSSNVNLADSTSNYINITGVQLEVGTVATSFEHLQYGQQLALCQRYYQYVSFFGTAANAGEMGVAGGFRTEMRTSPTLSIYSTSSVTVASEFTTHTLVRIGVGVVTVGNLTTAFLGTRGLYNIYCTGLASGGIYAGSTYVSAEL